MPSLAGAHAQSIPDQTDRDWPGSTVRIEFGKAEIERLRDERFHRRRVQQTKKCPGTSVPGHNFT